MGQAIDGPEPPSRRDYGKLVHDIGSLLEDARRSVVRHVTGILVDTYWHIGQRIVQFEQSGKDRADYGEMLIRDLSRDLTTRHGRGFDERNIRYMRKFYILYRKWNATRSKSQNQDAARPVFPLAWTHYRLLIGIDDCKKRAFYEKQCVRAGWSGRQLARQIDCMLYERLRLARHRGILLARADRENATVSPEDEIKDPYILDFLELKDDYSESELEDALIRHLEEFLLELGMGFAFVARQKTLLIGDERFKVDLVLYHMGLHCLVLIDLKAGKFSHADAGQMNFYLNYFKDRYANPGDNPPVGIILCADKNDTVVKYALGGTQNRIFVSRYRLRLPPETVLRDELLKEKVRFLERVAVGSGRGTNEV